MSFELKGSDRFYRRLKEYEGDTINGVSEVVAATAMNVVSVIGQSMHDAKSGRIYKLTQPTRRVHRASAPGEAPAVDFGTLSQSIQAMMINTYTWNVGTVLPYGRYLEYGTMRIAPRPWLAPAIEANRDNFNRLLSAALNEKGL